MSTTDSKITIYQIADEAGVSPATVSRVMSQKVKVSENKRRIVEDVIRKYRFKPNAMAQGLKAAQSQVLGIMVADIRNPYYSTMVVECENAARQLGYSVIVCNIHSDRDLEHRNLDKLYEQRVDGIIQMGCAVDDLVSDVSYVAHVNQISRSIPFVVTGKLDGANCYALNIDDNLVMDQIFRHLIDLGHSDIAFLGGTRAVKSTYDKYQRYIYLVNQYNLQYHEEFLVEGGYTLESGYASACTALSSPRKPTAVIAINDYSALGILNAITEHGLSVPDDISVVSFDNTYLSEVARPKLTSVDYDYGEYGRRLVNLVIRAGRNEEVEPVGKITSKLIIRDSCGIARR